ncbi:MAG: hypothetical protein ED559_14075 [Phycisphaera sp.]|nr:MAG: hypothetical protein ED559_14075 [Phycisphaera sp.]
MNTPIRHALLAILVAACPAYAQPADLDVDETQSSIFLEITLDTPLGAQTDDDSAAIDGTITLELDDYDNPTIITLIDYNFTSGSLGFVFDYSFLGTVTANATGLSLGLPVDAQPASGPVDAQGMFTVDNVPNEVTGIVSVGGTGTIGALVGSSTVDLSTVAQDPISVSGNINVASDTITLTISVPLEGSDTDPDTGVTVLFSGTTSVVATGPVPADECVADANGDGMLTPADFTAWINAFNNNLPECDQNGDAACTPTDFTAWISNFNAGCD